MFDPVLALLGGRKLPRCTGSFVVLAALVALAPAARAGVIPFVANPTSNSTDWTTTVLGLGGAINTNVNFNTHPTGPLTNTFYTASDGVTFSTTGPTNTVQSGAGPGQANTGSGPTSTGEGVHPASNFVFADFTASSTFTITFANPVLGAGLFTVDLFNPGSQPGVRNPVTLSAFTGPAGTGTLLGTFDSAQFNFQMNRLYYMGVVSTDGNIGSIRLNNPAGASDQIGIDNIRFAPAAAALVPEPNSLSLLGMGALGIVGHFSRRRRAG